LVVARIDYIRVQTRIYVIPTLDKATLRFTKQMVSVTKRNIKRNLFK